VGQGKESYGRFQKSALTRNFMVFNPHHILSRKIRRAWHVASVEMDRNAYGILVRKPEEKRPSRRPRPGWTDIKVDLTIG